MMADLVSRTYSKKSWSYGIFVYKLSRKFESKQLEREHNICIKISDTSSVACSWVYKDYYQKNINKISISTLLVTCTWATFYNLSKSTPCINFIGKSHQLRALLVECEFINLKQNRFSKILNEDFESVGFCYFFMNGWLDKRDVPRSCYYFEKPHTYKEMRVISSLHHSFTYILSSIFWKSGFCVVQCPMFPFQ